MSPHNKQTTELDQSETRKGLLTPLYFQCPNELVDYWLPRLNLVELRVFLFINRKTLGWHKIKDRISLSQIQEATGSQKIHILKAIDALMQKGLISKEVIGENGVQHTFYSLLFVDSNNSYQCQKDTHKRHCYKRHSNKRKTTTASKAEKVAFGSCCCFFLSFRN